MKKGENCDGEEPKDQSFKKGAGCFRLVYYPEKFGGKGFRLAGSSKADQPRRKISTSLEKKIDIALQVHIIFRSTFFSKNSS